MADIAALPDAIVFDLVSDVEALLTGIEGVTSVEIMPDGEPNKFRALEIYPHTKPIIDGEAGSTRHKLDLTIEGYVEGGSGKAALADVAKLYSAVIIVLLAPDALGRDTLVSEGGLRLSSAKLAAKKRLGFALDIEIEFATVRDDPTQLA